MFLVLELKVELALITFDHKVLALFFMAVHLVTEESEAAIPLTHVLSVRAVELMLESLFVWETDRCHIDFLGGIFDDLGLCTWKTILTLL